jgi:hypothetical protein
MLESGSAAAGIMASHSRERFRSCQQTAVPATAQTAIPIAMVRLLMESSFTPSF